MAAKLKKRALAEYNQTQVEGTASREEIKAATRDTNTSQKRLKLVLQHSASASKADILFLKHDSSIIRQSSNSICGFSTMEQVRLMAHGELTWLFHEPHTG